MVPPDLCVLERVQLGYCPARINRIGRLGKPVPHSVMMRLTVKQMLKTKKMAQPVCLNDVQTCTF